MKYRLKNREFQAQLDRLSRGDFSRRLDEWNGDRSVDLVNFSYGEETGHASFPRTFETAIRTADIEEVPTYDPSTWNEWPNINPPPHLLMRVEILPERPDRNDFGLVKTGARFRGCGFHDGQYWKIDGDPPLCMSDTVRFRPWEGKE